MNAHALTACPPRVRIAPALVAIILCITATACTEALNMAGYLDGPDRTVLTISPAAAVVVANQTIEFTVLGGYPPYDFTVEGGGTMDGMVYRAPASAGSVTVRVTDALGSTVAASLEITSAIGISPPAQIVFSGVTIEFAAYGGSGEYTYELDVNESGGTIDGTTGVYTSGLGFPGEEDRHDVILVTDLEFDASARAFVTVMKQPLSISPQTIEVFTNQTVEFSGVGGDPEHSAFQFAFASTGGSGSARALTPSGQYTSGLTPATDTVRMTDLHDGRTRYAIVTVRERPFDIAPLSSTVLPYQQVQFVAIGGYPGESSFEYVVLAPQHGVIDAATGIYTAGSTPATDTIRVTDQFDGRSRTATVTIVPLSDATDVDYHVTGITVPGYDDFVLVETPLNATVEIENIGTLGGQHPVSWVMYASLDDVLGGMDFVIASGILPGGLEADATAEISVDDGMWPPVPGEYHLIVVLDALDDLKPANNTFVTAELFSVVAQLTITPEVAVEYVGANELVFEAHGGRGPYEFSVGPEIGSSVHSTSGAYTAGSTSGVDTITATDSTSQSATATVHVLPEPEPDPDP